MCLSPITILHPSKYINLNRRDRCLLQVPCGHCAECRQTLSNHWLFRSFVEFTDCLNYYGDSFVYFDSLTYDSKHIPTIKDIIPSYPDNFQIFNSDHTHKFLDSLSKRLSRNYNASFRYFLSSEYGEKRGRPHYHILLFVYGGITPLELSIEISNLWKYGRTDGYPYKSAYYVNSHNTIKVKTTETMLRTANYVTKYVQKSCKYDKLLLSRLHNCMIHIGKEMVERGLVSDIDQYLNSYHCRCVREKINRRISQYHRQSQQYGASYLSELDLNKLVSDGCLFMPHPKLVSMPISLPAYYRRKLFQEQIKVDGVRVWQDTEVGKWYKKIRCDIVLKKLQQRYDCIAKQHNLRISNNLADYTLNRRGRILGHLPESSDYYERLEEVHIYNYCSKSDIRHYEKRLLSTKYFGNSTVGYTPIRGILLDYREFIEKCVYIDSNMEKCLDCITEVQKGFLDRKNKLMPLLQRLRQVHKDLQNVTD